MGTAVVAGIGSRLPPRAVDNAELAARLGSSDEWIRTRTGVSRRYVAEPGTAVSDLAAGAGARALKSAGGGPVDAVVLATQTPDHPCPGTAPDVATRLGLWSAAAFDVAAVCSGFVYALAVGTGLIAVSIVPRAGDRRRRVLRHPRPGRPGHLGDLRGRRGRGRAARRRAGRTGCARPVRPRQRRRRSAHHRPGGRVAAAAVGRRARSPRALLRDGGKAVFWRAVQQMAQSSQAALDRAGWTPGDVDHLVCHQANQRITDHLADELGLPRERAVQQHRRGRQHGRRVDPARARPRARGGHAAARRPGAADRVRRRAGLGIGHPAVAPARRGRDA